MFVGPFLKRTERPVDKEQHYTNVFVKNLSENVSDEELEKMFNEHGKVCSPWHPSTILWMTSIHDACNIKKGGSNKREASLRLTPRFLCCTGDELCHHEG